MSTALRPVLRPSTASSLTYSLSSVSSSSQSTTYICHACRHARLLRRPKRPYTFTQLVTLSDGSAFTVRTTSPLPVYRSSRDTRNSPLWNPSSKELLNVEEDEAGRLAGFRARFGTGFDANKELVATVSTTAEPEKAASEQKVEKKTTAKAKETEPQDDLFGLDFADDDAGLLEMISSYGREDKGTNAQLAKKKQK